MVRNFGWTTFGETMNVVEQERAEAAARRLDTRALVAVLARSRQLDFALLVNAALSARGDASEFVNQVLPHMQVRDLQYVRRKPLLHEAITANRPLTFLETLGRLGFDFNEPYVMDWTPLHYAAQWPTSRNGSAVVQLAARYGKHPETCGSSGTPLHILFSFASEIGDSARVAMMHALLDYGTPVNAVNSRGATALHHAAKNSIFWSSVFPQILNTLLDRGAYLDAVDADGYTPLGQALIQSNPDAIQVLLDAGSDCSATVDDGVTMLELASLYQDETIIRAIAARHDFSQTDIQRAIRCAERSKRDCAVAFLRTLAQASVPAQE